MKYLLAFTLLCVVTCLEGRKFRCDYQYYGHIDAWLKLHRVPADWQEAMLHCHFEGSHLASPLYTGVKDVMKSLIKSNTASKCTFTGIHATFSTGNFFSIEGVPLFKIPHTWAEGEPDNYNNDESCIAMLSDGALADVNCSEPLPYICYKKNNNVFFHPCGTADSEYNLDIRTGSCYKFHAEPKTWSRAYMTCSDEGGHLAIINSDLEAQVIKELFAKNPPNSMVGNFWKDVAFMGFHSWGEKGGEFITIHGETLKQAGYWKFGGGQPDNATTGEYCGAVFRSAELDDMWCENRVAFICEKSRDSLLCDDVPT